MNRAWIIAAVGAAGACDSAVSDPTWVDDIQTIVQANCVRCHGDPAIGGAPQGFRLDRYDDTVHPDGWRTPGAATMAEFMAHRAGVEGDMPPDGEMTDAQRETIANWRPRLGERPGNAAPTATADMTVSADGEPFPMSYEILDADGDLVSGELVLIDADGERVVDATLQSGRGERMIDPGVHPDGALRVVFRLSDGLTDEEVEVGTVNIAHGDGNVAPRVVVTSPPRNAIIADIDAPYEVAAQVTDPDGDALKVTFFAVRGDQEIEIAREVDVDADGFARATWDTTGVPDAPNWRVRAVASDNTASREAWSHPVIVSHGSTTTTFGEIAGFFDAYCTPCHTARFETLKLPFDLAAYAGDADILGVYDLRGAIYRRVILQRDMPPPSAAGVEPNTAAITDDDRAVVGDWLLGGAPD